MTLDSFVRTNDEVVSSSAWKSAGLLNGVIMAKRRGKKPKTKQQIQQEMKENLERVLRIASVFHNIQRNKETRRISKLQVRRFTKELKLSRDQGEKEVSRYLIKDCMSTVDKMESFIKEDASFLNKELKVIRIIGPKK
jgi:hypothetical protein